MTGRRTVPVQLDTATVAIAELAAERARMSTAEWITKTVRDEAVRTGLGSNYTDLTEAEMVTDDADLAAAGAIEERNQGAPGGPASTVD